MSETVLGAIIGAIGTIVAAIIAASVALLLRKRAKNREKDATIDTSQQVIAGSMKDNTIVQLHSGTIQIQAGRYSPIHGQKEAKGQKPRIVTDGVRIENSKLRILFTIWNRMDEDIRISEIKTKIYSKRDSLSFATGPRTELQLKGNESNLWEGETTFLGVGQSEAFDLNYKIEKGDAKSIITFGLVAHYKTSEAEDLICSSELFIYDSFYDKVRTISERELFNEMNDFPFEMEHTRLLYDYISHRPDLKTTITEGLLALYASSLEAVREQACKEGRLSDADMSISLWNEIQKVFPKDWEPSDWLERFRLDQLAKANSLHLTYFGKDRHIWDGILDALIEEWDPLSLGDDPRSRDEYSSYLRNIYKLLLEHKSDEEIIKECKRLAAEQGHTEALSYDRFIQRLRKINLQIE